MGEDVTFTRDELEILYYAMLERIDRLRAIGDPRGEAEALLEKISDELAENEWSDA